MGVNIKAQAAPEIETDALIVLIPQGDSPGSAIALDEPMNRALSDLLATGDFTGKAGQVAVLYPRSGVKAKRLILSGLGSVEGLNAEAVRRAVGAGVRKAREFKVGNAALSLLNLEKLPVRTTAQAVIEGALLANYHYSGQKNDDPTHEIPEFSVCGAESEQDEIKAGVAVGEAFAAGTITTRNLVNLPPNLCTPIYLASRARNIAEATGMKIEVLEKAQMEELRMGALLAVAQGSDTPPRFIILEHNPSLAGQGKTVVLVGKGVTFDTGGYSLKPADSMVGMKADMAGAAAVIGAMQTVAMSNVPLHVVGLVPSADNMISGHAYRPEEVITASNDKTIEIISTDAEGRLLLADALVYAKRYNPAAVVDIATLTGSCVIALGHVTAGMFSTDDTLRDQLMAAGTSTNEKVWPLPLYPEYKKYIESNTADMKNSGGRDNGIATSAVFLQEFIDYPAWAHIDMAGMMNNVPESPYLPGKGANGYGSRLLAEFVRLWSAK